MSGTLTEADGLCTAKFPEGTEFLDAPVRLIRSETGWVEEAPDA